MLSFVFSFLSVCLYFLLLVVFSVFGLRCVCSKTSGTRGFIEEFAYLLLLDVVVVCLLLLFPSFDVVVCLPIVPCSAKYFLFFMFSVSCCFRCVLLFFLFFLVFFQARVSAGGRGGEFVCVFLGFSVYGVFLVLIGVVFCCFFVVFLVFS